MFLLDIAIFRFHVKCKECSQQQEALILWHIDRMKKIQEHGDVNSTKFEFYRQNCRWNQNKTASQEKYLPEIIFKHCLCTKSNIMRIWHQSQQNWYFELNHWSFFEIQVAPFKNPWHFLKMDRSGAGVNPTARWYSVLHLSSNFWAKGTQFPTPADPEGFFRQKLCVVHGKMGFFRTPTGPTVSQGIFWGKVAKGYFNISEDFFSWGAASLETCEWIWNRSRIIFSHEKVIENSPKLGLSNPFRRPRRILPGEVVWVAQTGDHHGDVTNFFVGECCGKNSHGAALRCRPCFPSPRTNRGPSHHLGAVLSGGKFQPTSPLFFRILEKPWLPLDNQTRQGTIPGL